MAGVNADSVSGVEDPTPTTSSSVNLLPITSARVNPQVEGLRQSLLAACSVQESLDDDEMREYDPREHFETLGAGIPQHLAQKTGPRYVKPRHYLGSTDEEMLSIDSGNTGESFDKEELSPVVKATSDCCCSTSKNSETPFKTSSSPTTVGDWLEPDMTSLEVGGATCASSNGGV